MTSPSIELPTGRRARLTGIGLICLAVACFSLLDTGAKYLTGHLPIMEIVWARYAFHVLCTLGFINPLREPGVWTSRRPMLQVMRGLLLVTVTVCNFIALHYLQLDQTVSIGFAAPFLVAILAGPVLGEWVGWRRMIAIAIGFVGVLFVARPGLQMHPAVLISLFSAACNAMYSLATRMLASHDNPRTTLFISGVVGTAAAAPFLLVAWEWPTAVQWAMLAVVGVLGAGGHYLLILAHHHAPASVIAPFNYSQLLWMTTLGYLAFGNLPSSTTLLGAAVMILAGIYLIEHERRTGIADTPNVD